MASTTLRIDPGTRPDDRVLMSCWRAQVQGDDLGGVVQGRCWRCVAAGKLPQPVRQYAVARHRSSCLTGCPLH